MTEQTQPTDAELLDAADDFRSQYKHGGTTFDEFDALGFARAALAKWGQPDQAAEPVYAFRRKGFDDFCTCTEKRYAELSAKPNLFETRIFYTAPQPVERKPLPVIELMRIVMDVEQQHHFLRGTPNWASAVGRAVERAHGIKGGQHGTE